MTLVRAVVAKALRDAAAFNAGANSAPAAVLWADPERTCTAAGTPSLAVTAVIRLACRPILWVTEKKPVSPHR